MFDAHRQADQESEHCTDLLADRTVQQSAHALPSHDKHLHHHSKSVTRICVNIRLCQTAREAPRPQNKPSLAFGAVIAA
eukprot:5025145-Amphidinium_carterae.1